MNPFIYLLYLNETYFCIIFPFASKIINSKMNPASIEACSFNRFISKYFSNVYLLLTSINLFSLGMNISVVYICKSCQSRSTCYLLLTGTK